MNEREQPSGYGKRRSIWVDENEETRDEVRKAMME